MAPAEKPIGRQSTLNVMPAKAGNQRTAGPRRLSRTAPYLIRAPGFAGVTTYYESVNDGMKSDELRKNGSPAHRKAEAGNVPARGDQVSIPGGPEGKIFLTGKTAPTILSWRNGNSSGQLRSLHPKEDPVNLITPFA